VSYTVGKEDMNNITHTHTYKHTKTSFVLGASQFILCTVMISYMQKLNRRRTALQKAKAITEEVKAKWKPCMVLD